MNVKFLMAKTRREQTTNLEKRNAKKRENDEIRTVRKEKTKKRKHENTTAST